MAAKLILVRHGETLLNRDGRVQGLSDAPLSDLGQAQARAVADALTPDAPFHLYASPLSRAAQTARPIADAHGVIPTTVADLREADVGDLDGLTIAQVSERYPRFHAPLGRGRRRSHHARRRIAPRRALPRLARRV